MTTQRDSRIRELKAIESECFIAKSALALAEREARLDGGTFLSRADAKMSDLTRAASNSELTYFTRLFASFEGSLREYRKTYRPTNPQAKDLLDSIASKVKCTTDRLADVHKARNDRNDAVHGGLTTLPETLGTYRQYLCRFLAELPREW